MYHVSIILPVYNVAPYIVRCMDSLRVQTLPNLEVLFVDDWGADNSVAVIEEYICSAGLSADWHVLHTPCNSGPGAARNVGIEAAKGEYVAFVDGDDWIEPNMLETLYHMAQKHGADLSSSAAVMDFADGSHRLMLNPSVGSGPVTTDMRKYLLRHFVSNFTTMLFRREWLVAEALRFPTATSGEDSCYMGQCYLLCRRIAQCDTPFYHYLIHPSSISHRRHVYRGWQKREAFGALLSFARRRGLWPEYKLELIWVYFKKAVVSSIVDYIKSYL